MNKADTVNLFFACDDGYIPFLAVTLASIKKHRSPARDYSIRVLNTGISERHKERILDSVAELGFNIEFVDITKKVEEISEKLHLSLSVVKQAIRIVTEKSGMSRADFAAIL